MMSDYDSRDQISGIASDVHYQHNNYVIQIDKEVRTVVILGIRYILEQLIYLVKVLHNLCQNLIISL